MSKRSLSILLAALCLLFGMLAAFKFPTLGVLFIFLVAIFNYKLGTWYYKEDADMVNSYDITVDNLTNKLDAKEKEVAELNAALKQLKEELATIQVPEEVVPVAKKSSKKAKSKE